MMAATAAAMSIAVPDTPSKAAAATNSESVLNVAVAATFTADGLELPLGFVLSVAGLTADLVFAPYHQVFQELLTTRGALADNTAGVNVLLLRLEDFLRDTSAVSSASELLARTLDELIEAIGSFCRRSPTPLIVLVMRATPMVPAALVDELETASSTLCDALRAIAGIQLLVSGEIDRLCPTASFDPIADRLAHIPYTDDYFAAMALVLARRIHLLRTPAHKVLVLDCDNTIWGGVVGEDGPQGLAIDPAFLAVQQFAVDAQIQGALVCLASKNVEADVLDVLDTRPDMVLKTEHIVAHRVNWEAKASNLRSLARELNLGLDSFVFVDDNPIECGQVMEALPEVVTLQLPPPDEVVSFLANLWTFDKAAVTQEDARRTSMYRENAARDTLEAEAGDIGEFLAALDLKIDIAPPTDAEWARVSQLTQRTNQFNFTTARRSEAELRALAAAGTQVLAVHVRDRFGDYGLVGVVIATLGEVALEVDTFLLSCRVLGRGVEHSIVARLGELAEASARAAVRLPFKRTSKNEPARAFADSILAAYREGVGDVFEYVVPAAVAAAIRHRAGEDAVEVIEARKADVKKPPKTAPLGTGRSERYLRLATELTTGPAVMRALRAQTARPRDLTTAVAAPRTSTERALLVLWEEILGVDGLGATDDFFALGGSSLQAARMFAEIGHRRGVSLPLTTILEAPTVRALAAQVDRGGVVGAGGVIALRPAGERKLFLVHDGDGETLLYRNIAQRAPADVGVFGIQPTRLKNVPLAHLSIEEMARAYIVSMREVQPQGPLSAGCMCAGGLIAYEMAVQLTHAGEPVERVLLLDAATPQAERRHVSHISQRKERLRHAMAAARAGRSGVSALVSSLGVVARKMISVASYELAQGVSMLSVRARFALLRWVLAGQREWPSFVPSLDFRAIYNVAEARYRPTTAPTVSALLVRASAGEGADLPYVKVYEDVTLGWGAVVRQLEVADVGGGHASMLQEPHAADLAATLQPHIARMPSTSEPRIQAADG